MQLRFPAISSLKNIYMYMFFQATWSVYKKERPTNKFLLSLLKLAGKQYFSLQVDSEHDQL